MNFAHSLNCNQTSMLMLSKRQPEKLDSNTLTSIGSRTLGAQTEKSRVETSFERLAAKHRHAPDWFFSHRYPWFSKQAGDASWSDPLKNLLKKTVTSVEIASSHEGGEKGRQASRRICGDIEAH